MKSIYLRCICIIEWLELQYSQRPLEGSAQYKQHQLRYFQHGFLCNPRDFRGGGGGGLIFGDFLDGEKSNETSHVLQKQYWFHSEMM